MIVDQTNYGVLSDLVSGAGSLIAAVGAIGMGWRRRAKWEPSEIDVDKGPQRVGSLLAAVVIAVIWVQMRTSDKLPTLIKLSIGLVIGTVLFLCVYGLLISIYTYEKEVSETSTIKVIGGFSLTPSANQALRKKEKSGQSLSVQELFKGSAYNMDKIWPRWSRAFAKLLFVICYLGLTASGTIALACAAIILGLSQKS